MSDNFVRLNMKVKRFSRGKGRLSGSAYKRKEWKKGRAQEEEGGAAGRGGRGTGRGGHGTGRNVCFKCGKSGHWAKNCTDKGGFTNLGKFGGERVKFDEAMESKEEQLDSATLDALVRDSPFPTIKEAAEMAYGIKPTRPDDVSGAASPLDLDDSESQQDQLSMTDSSEQTSTPSFLPPPPRCEKSPPQPMEPFLKLSSDGGVGDTPPVVYEALGKFGYQSFRDGQEEAIMRILSGLPISLFTLHPPPSLPLTFPLSFHNSLPSPPLPIPLSLILHPSLPPSLPPSPPLSLLPPHPAARHPTLRCISSADPVDRCR